MSVLPFDAFARRAGVELSRRASLLTLRTAGLATLASPIVAEAKKKERKNKSTNKATKKCKKDLAECSAQELHCSRQVDECIPVVTAACGGGPGCQTVIACCQFLGDCDVTSFLDCLDASDS